MGTRIDTRTTFRPVLIVLASFPTRLSLVCDDARVPEEDWGQQLEMFTRSCRALAGSVPVVEIFMRGLKAFPDLPSSVMRRLLRAFYNDLITENDLFEENLLPVCNQ